MCIPLRPQALNKMVALVTKEQDLPVGTTRESLQKTIRLKKSEAAKKGQWGTPVEIEYKNLMMTITNAQVSQLGSWVCAPE